jgi:predicted metalloendopeptidase
MRIMFSLGVMVLVASAALAQQPASAPQAPPKELPQVEHFNAANVDTKAEPCDDFFKYANAKWFAAHPIPADQVVCGIDSPLQLWNETVLLQTLEVNPYGQKTQTS